MACCSSRDSGGLCGPEKPRRGLREDLRLGGGAAEVVAERVREEAVRGGRVKVPTEEARCFGSGGTTTIGAGVGAGGAVSVTPCEVGKAAHLSGEGVLRSE